MFCFPVGYSAYVLALACDSWSFPSNMKLTLQLWLATAGVFFFPPDPPLKLSFSLHVVWVWLLVGGPTPSRFCPQAVWTSPVAILAQALACDSWSFLFEPPLVSVAAS